jgi:hypothetical protein
MQCISYFQKRIPKQEVTVSLMPGTIFITLHHKQWCELNPERLNPAPFAPSFLDWGSKASVWSTYMDSSKALTT